MATQNSQPPIAAQARPPPAPSLQPLPLVQHPPPFMNYPLQDIVHPHPHDVLCGRGGQSNTHPGNNQWRMLVATNKELYVSLPKKQKMLLSQSIVNAVRSQTPMGRFLQKDAKTDLWLDVGDKRAQEKTSQALREGAPELRTKLEQKSATIATSDADPGASVDGSTLPVLDTRDTGAVPTVPGAVTVTSAATTPRDDAPDAPHVEDIPSAPVSLPGPPGPFVRSTSKEQMPPPAAVVKAQPPPSQYTHPDYAPTESLYPSPSDKYAPVQEAYQSYPHEKHDLSALHPPYNHSHPEPYLDEYHSDMAPPPPPTALDPHGDCSFGSMGLMSDAEQARLENGVSFGTMNQPIEQPYSHATPQNPDLVSSYENYGHQLHPEQQRQQAPYPAVRYISFANDQDHPFRHGDDTMPHPVDGGLEPIGLSFGSMMSMGTTTAEAAAAAAENIKLEGAGLSFGSMMSYSVVGGMGPHASLSGPVHPSLQYKSSAIAAAAHAPPDGGLHDIGTSFGSLTLADGDRERILADAERDMMAALHNDTLAAPPTFLHNKSKGNLLDCSDTESEDEETSAGISAQKSADWDKMQAAMAQQIQNSYASSYGAIPPPLYNGGHGGTQHIPASGTTHAGTTFHMPTGGLDREFSQMSAISVGEDFEPMPAYLSPPSHEGSSPTEMSPPSDIKLVTGSKLEDWKGEDPDLEYTYLNRGNSLASEAFSEAPELAKTFDHL